MGGYLLTHRMTSLWRHVGFSQGFSQRNKTTFDSKPPYPLYLWHVDVLFLKRYINVIIETPYSFTLQVLSVSMITRQLSLGDPSVFVCPTATQSTACYFTRCRLIHTYLLFHLLQFLCFLLLLTSSSIIISSYLFDWHKWQKVKHVNRASTVKRMCQPGFQGRIICTYRNPK